MEVQADHSLRSEPETAWAINEQIYVLIAEGTALLASPAVLRRCVELCGAAEVADTGGPAAETASRASSGYDMFLHRHRSRAARGAVRII